jgi:adenine/guanine phosphoribosyltransferase-like PRPP-binding protein
MIEIDTFEWSDFVFDPLDEIDTFEWSDFVFDPLESDVAKDSRLQVGLYKRAGYRITDGLLLGIALLSARQIGANLIYRLKDTRPLLIDEIRFWGGQLARLVGGNDFDYVTTPPDSGKVSLKEHLASNLAMACAEELNLPFVRVFDRHEKSGRRRIGKEKRQDTQPFIFSGTPGRVLVVDDVIYTRSTAKKCMEAARNCQLFFDVLYRA